MGLPFESVDESANPGQKARARLAESRREEQKQTQERREGRKHGELSRSLEEKIEACNPKQLKRVIKLARLNLKDHKQAPERWQIHLYGNTKLLAHASRKNKLYCLELRSCGKPNCRKCPHGPYVFSYHRDGQYYPSKSESDFSRLPKPIRDLFAPIRAEMKANAAKQA